jgi:hypothetical protein
MGIQIRIMLVTFMRIQIRILLASLMWTRIRILLVSLMCMRFRILPLTLMWIRIFPFSLMRIYADPDPQHWLEVPIVTACVFLGTVFSLNTKTVMLATLFFWLSTEIVILIKQGLFKKKGFE